MTMVEQTWSPLYTGGSSAEVAQLVERNLAKVEVAGSSPVFRSRSGFTADRGSHNLATWPSG